MLREDEVLVSVDVATGEAGEVIHDMLREGEKC